MWIGVKQFLSLTAGSLHMVVALDFTLVIRLIPYWLCLWPLTDGENRSRETKSVLLMKCSSFCISESDLCIRGPRNVIK